MVFRSFYSALVSNRVFCYSPAGSVGAAESTGELKAGHRNRWFIFATDFQIDLGFVISAFVPMIVVLATGENHLHVAWRICLALGALPPLSLLYLRCAGSIWRMLLESMKLTFFLPVSNCRNQSNTNATRCTGSRSG